MTVPDQGVLAAILDAAGAAPSPHNTQPWSFSLIDDRIELRPDPTRALPVQDPQGRELLISCGAALTNLQLAVSAAGYTPLVDTEAPGALAAVRLGERRPTPAADTELFAAIATRHTHRGPFDGPTPTADDLAPIIAAASEENTSLEPVDDPGAARAIAEMVARAEGTNRHDGTMTEEISHWVRPDGSSGDGIEQTLVGLAIDAASHSPFSHRDYSGALQGAPKVATGGEPGILAVLFTAEDDEPSWLAAGRGLERLLLTAAAHGIVAAFYTQPLEHEHLRKIISEELETDAHPQMIMLLGRSSELRRAPKRPASTTVR